MAMQENAQCLKTVTGCDTYIFNAEIDASNVERLRDLVLDKDPKSETAALFINTAGGDADAAYRLAATLNQAYKSFTAYVFDRCKSAGTLAVIGAEEIVFGAKGELGPLDVQVAKRDEMFMRNSGLDLFEALAVIRNSAFESFEHQFITVMARSGGSISARMASEIASQLSVGLFSPMTQQIDPERLGELQRAINIANVYGHRLDKGLLKDGALDKLVQGYPSHGYVIDFPEAENLFNRVRRSTDEEQTCIKELKFITNRLPTPIILDLDVLTPDIPSGGDENEQSENDQNRNPQAADRAANEVKPDATGDADTPKRNTDARKSAKRKTTPRKKRSTG